MDIQNKDGSISETLKTSIDRSRQCCMIADFHNALAVLDFAKHHTLGDAEELLTIQAEEARVYILKGDYNAASETLTQHNAPNGHPLQLVLQAQLAYVEILTDCKLAEGAVIAGKIWNSLGAGLESAFISPAVAWTLYYCLRIFDFVLAYGSRKLIKSMPINEKFLLFFVVLEINVLHSCEGMQLEALSLIYYLCNSDTAFKILSEQRKSIPTSLDTSIMFLHFGKTVGYLENDAILTSLQELEHNADISIYKTALLDIQAAKIRLVEDNNEPKFQVDTLISISQDYLKQGYFEKSAEILRFSQDFLGSFAQLQPSTLEWLAQMNIKLCDLLQENYRNHGDALGFLEASFEKYGKLRLSIQKSSLARQEIEKVMKSPNYLKIASFKRYHMMLAEEYLFLKQGKDALYHAKRYFRYCKKCRSRSEQASARNLVFKCLLESARMSFSIRTELLDSIREYLAHAISSDQKNLERSCKLLNRNISRINLASESHLMNKVNEANAKFDEANLQIEIDGFNSALAEAYMLVLEVEEEQSRLEQDDQEDMTEQYIQTLELAEKYNNQILSDRLRPAKVALGTEISSLKFTLSQKDPKHPETPEIGISLSNYIGLFTLAESKKSYTIMEHYVEDLNQKEREIDSNGTVFGKILTYECRVVIIYFLLNLEDDNTTPICEKAGFSSMFEGVMLMVDYIRKCFHLRDTLVDGFTGTSRMHDLQRTQSFFAGFARFSQIIQDILALCVVTDDPQLSWELVQLVKARGIVAKQSSDATKERRYPIVTSHDLDWASTAADRNIVFIDWIEISTEEDSPLLLVAVEYKRGNTQAKFCQRQINIALPDLIQWSEGYRQKLHQRDFQDYLDRLTPIIAPLEEFEGGDILILSPTSHIQNFPLHALQVGGKLLLERNPIAYTPSLSVLVQCLRRLERPLDAPPIPPPWKAALMSALDDESNDKEVAQERTKVYDYLQSLGELLGQPTVTGEALSSTKFIDEACIADMVHFHGHGLHDSDAIEEQALVMGKNDYLTLPQMFEKLQLKQSPHVTMIACNSSTQDFSLGSDEPLGILTAFLVAGAGSVIGPLWTIQSEDGRMFAERLYHELFHLESQTRKDQFPLVNLAVAVQEAALSIRQQRSSPYHWAGYVLNGSWFCKKRPEN